MVDGAWRIPFLIAIPLGAVAIWFRLKIPETPSFEASVAEGLDVKVKDDKYARHGLIGVVRHFWREILIGIVEWLGDAAPVTHEPARPVHLELFTVLQAQGQTEVSMRMTDGVSISSWTVDAMRDGAFRSGDLDAERVRWAEGEGPAELVCIPVQDGEWAIIADVVFADDAGSGTYYWRLNVSRTPGA